MRRLAALGVALVVWTAAPVSKNPASKNPASMNLASTASASEPAADVEKRAQREAVEPSGVHVAIGPLVASRAMQLRVDSETISHQPGLYLGATARLGVELVDFADSDAVLFLQGGGGYGASRNAEAAAELRRAPVTEWSFVSARLDVRRHLTAGLAVDVGLGGYANSFIVEPNRTYTGHRYLAADIYAGLRWDEPSTNWSASADLSAYPVLSVNQSSGAYGDSSAFGARVGAQLGYNVATLESAGGYAGGRILLRYDYTRFRSQFPQARIGLDDGVSEDDIHALTLMLGYFL